MEVSGKVQNFLFHANIFWKGVESLSNLWKFQE